MMIPVPFLRNIYHGEGGLSKSTRQTPPAATSTMITDFLRKVRKVLLRELELDDIFVRNECTAATPEPSAAQKPTKTQDSWERQELAGRYIMGGVLADFLSNRFPEQKDSLNIEVSTNSELSQGCVEC